MTNELYGRFTYRVAAAWLPQFGRHPYPQLFSSTASDQLFADYAESMPRLKEAGFDYLELAGLIGETGAGQIPIKDGTFTSSPERDVSVKRSLNVMRDVGLNYVHALGVYSWGFEEVIRAHPELAGLRVSDPDMKRPGWDEDMLPYIDRLGPATIPAKDVLCASREESWDWMQRSIDWQLETYPEIDGFHLESADQGRCWCQMCRKINSVEYHTRINERTGEYLRQVAPEKTIFINNCGGDWGSIRALPYVQRLAKYADFIQDYMDSFWLPVEISQWGRQVKIDSRAKAVNALTTVYGQTLHIRDAGLPRDRFFQPLPQSIYLFVTDSYQQGCRGMQFYSAGPIYNPGSEFNMEFVGATLSNPEASYDELFDQTLDKLYQPGDHSTLAELRELFETAEIAAAESFIDLNKTHHTVIDINRGIPGYTRLIPTFSLASYKGSIERLAQRTAKVTNRLGNTTRAERLQATLEGTALAMADALESRLSGEFDGTPLRPYVRPE